jgi:hypothetical protein
MLNRRTVRSVWRRLNPESESVTFKVRGTSDTTATYTSYTVDYAKRFPESRMEYSTDGVVVATLGSCKWHLWKENLDAASAPIPKGGDIIEDSDGIGWVITSVDKHLFGEVYHCETAQQP